MKTHPTMTKKYSTQTSEDEVKISWKMIKVIVYYKQLNNLILLMDLSYWSVKSS